MRTLPWAFVIVVGPILLALVMAWAALRNRNRSRQSKELSEKGSRDLYAQIDREDAERDMLEDKSDYVAVGIATVPGQPRPNLSTEHQKDGDARRPRDTLDREPKRDPVSGAAIPSDYNPETMTRER